MGSREQSELERLSELQYYEILDTPAERQFDKFTFSYGAITRYGQPFQAVLINRWLKRAGCSDFARHYFRNLG